MKLFLSFQTKTRKVILNMKDNIKHLSSIVYTKTDKENNYEIKTGLYS